MPKIIDVTYYCHSHLKAPEEVLKIHFPANGFAHWLSQPIEFIKHLDYEGTLQEGHIRYRFFNRSNRFWAIPWQTHRYIRRHEPDVVLIQGLIYPIQVWALKRILNSETKVIIQNHGEKPFKGIKRLLQKLAYRHIDAFIFTAADNSLPWKELGIIPKGTPCFEILEASTTFTKKANRDMLKRILGIHGNPCYLWVGRLNSNKDPLTALEAFSSFRCLQPDARLYMMFHEADLLNECRSYIDRNGLKDYIHLIGRVDHAQLEDWYNAADFYVSASHREGSGYALLEAMACGCIPIVTAIPSFKKMTANGAVGLLFEPGDPGSLLTSLLLSTTIDIDTHSTAVASYFREELSFKKIASDFEHAIAEVLRGREPHSQKDGTYILPAGTKG